MYRIKLSTLKSGIRLVICPHIQFGTNQSCSGYLYPITWILSSCRLHTLVPIWLHPPWSRSSPWQKAVTQRTQKAHDSREKEVYFFVLSNITVFPELLHSITSTTIETATCCNYQAWKSNSVDCSYYWLV